MTTKYVVTWMGSWDRKKTLGVKTKKTWIKYGLWQIIMYQYFFINFKQCTILKYDVNSREKNKVNYLKKVNGIKKLYD